MNSKVMWGITRSSYVVAGLLLAAQLPLFAAEHAAPDWAYGYLKPLSTGDAIAPPCAATAKPFPDCAYAGEPVPEDGIKHELPGTTAKFSRAEVYFDFGPADWYPGDHPPMPEIVAKGRQSAGVRACALCHYPNGQGKMENGGVAGLPVAYILQQLEAFKNGTRHSADPRKANSKEMAQIARSLTEAETLAAANYFASLQWRPWVTVIETTTSPRVRASVNGLFLPINNALPITLGSRIIEVPANPEKTSGLRDPRSGFIAYVPRGSIAKGATLAAGDGVKTLACGACHGVDLKGVGNVPGIAGRSPTYLMRQLWDLQQGSRKSAIMEPLVAKLDINDMISLSAFIASQSP